MNKIKGTVNMHLNKEETEKYFNAVRFDMGDIGTILLAIIMLILQIVLFIKSKDITSLAFATFLAIYIIDYVKLTKDNRFSHFIADILLARIEKGEVECEDIEITIDKEE